jgi:hypothetical protein
VQLTEVQSPFARSALVASLFAAGLVAIPFDAVRGVGALGELGNELSFPFFAAAIAGALFVSAKKGDSCLRTSLVLRVAAIAMAVVFLSYLINIGGIHGATFRERTAINKFLTSLLVVLYGFGLAWLSERLEPERFVSLVARFVCWSVAISIFYLLFELAGNAGLLGGLFDAVDNVVHTRQADVVNAWDGSINAKVLYGWDERLRSVSFEPPAFGNYTGFAWPWVWFAALNASPPRRPGAWTLLAVFTLVVIFAASRTGLLMLVANCAVLALLRLVYARPSTSEALAAARLLLPVVFGLITIAALAWIASSYNDVVQQLMLGESISNITRLAFQAAGLQIFLDHPLLGVGLGQFGFHVAAALPDWAWRSSEVHPMLTFPQAGWPNVFSIYARLAAELGILGLIGWIALWLGLAARLARNARSERANGGSRVTLHYPIVMNCVGVLVSGLTTDTFRTPMVWVALGLGCGVLARSRGGRPAAASAAPVPS